MIIDCTGVVLTPGNNGEGCLGDGEHYDENGELIEICCENCDYFLCRYPDERIIKISCKDCVDTNCPNSPKLKE